MPDDAPRLGGCHWPGQCCENRLSFMPSAGGARGTPRHAAESAGRGHQGLTLVEVILVLALLVVIGAVSAPLLEGSFSRAGLQSAADVVRGAWSKARIAALQSGQTHVFRFEPHGGRFQVVLINDLGLPASNDLQPQIPGTEQRPVDMLRLSRSRLPDGVFFAAADISSSRQLAAMLPDVEGGSWSQPVVFHADGTTSDASLLLSNQNQNTIRVTLRGLTGISNTGHVDSEAAP
jgi:prepilin-type N-terminal cleavage/methylation domain-containing protein